MKNIFYFSFINEIGGVESMFYYLAKKYQDWDITVYYQTGDENQIKRLKKYVRVKKYNGEKIVCNKAFLNYYSLDFVNNVEAKEYIQIIHVDYKAVGLPFKRVDKINRYIAVSKKIADSFETQTGLKAEVCYNPIEVDTPKKVLKLISATRLTAEKGKNRIIKLGKLLDKANIPYLWTIFTNDTEAINNPNIIYMKPRLNIIDYIADADYLVQLSDDEAYCYSVIESLSVGTPVIVTDCPVYKELGLKNGENAFILDFNLSNVNIKDIYKKSLKFQYEAKEDTWSNILVKGESQYKKDMKKFVKVQCISNFYDAENNLKLITTDTKPFKVNKVRAEDLADKGLVEIL